MLEYGTCRVEGVVVGLEVVALVAARVLGNLRGCRSARLK